MNNSQTGRDRTREIVRQRDKKTCVDCGVQWKQGMRKLDVHHIFERRASKKYDKVSDIGRLITLCHKCHMKRHVDFDKSTVIVCENCGNGFRISKKEMRNRKHCSQKCCEEKYKKLGIDPKWWLKT